MKKTALPGWVRGYDTKYLQKIRRFFKKARSSVFLLVLAFIFFRLNPAFGASRPNIIFLLTDDMGYGDTSCYGGNFVPTPNIDEMAKEGTRFTQFYVASPVCSPSRVGYLTGNFPAHWRIDNYLQTRAGNRQSEQADYLDPAAIRLRIEFFQLSRFNDGFDACCYDAHNRVYYRSVFSRPAGK